MTFNRVEEREGREEGRGERDSMTDFVISLAGAWRVSRAIIHVTLPRAPNCFHFYAKRDQIIISTAIKITDHRHDPLAVSSASSRRCNPSRSFFSVPQSVIESGETCKFFLPCSESESKFLTKLFFFEKKKLLTLENITIIKFQLHNLNIVSKIWKLFAYNNKNPIK